MQKRELNRRAADDAGGLVTVSRASANRWLRQFHPTPDAAVRLVCFPHAGGSASMFYGLSAVLATDVDVFAVQYPGRQDRMAEPLVDQLDELAERLVEPVAALADRPLAFFGHSMGATVAFELARRLQGRSQPAPDMFFASARIAPARSPGPLPPMRDDADIVSELARLNGANAAVLESPELLELVLPVLHNDYHAVATYRYTPGPPLACPAAVLIGDADPVLTGAEALAWGEHFAGEVGLRVFPGGHFYLDEQCEAVADFVRSALPRGTSGER